MGMGFSADKLKELCIAGMFHDMGKLEVPAEILNKPSKLTTEEYDIIKKHPQKSYDLLADRFEISSNVRMGVLCHHENEDGSGYPRGLTGDKINIFAKILHVVDVYDALTSKRSYKKAYACSEALEYLMGGTATLFDEKVVDVFMKYVPIYPKGMQVLLSDGRKGVIVRNNHISSLRPVVRMVVGLDIDLCIVTVPSRSYVRQTRIQRHQRRSHRRSRSAGRSRGIKFLRKFPEDAASAWCFHDSRSDSL